MNIAPVNVVITTPVPPWLNDPKWNVPHPVNPPANMPVVMGVRLLND